MQFQSSNNQHNHLRLLQIPGILLLAVLLSACSVGQMVVRGSQTILDSGVDSMNRETDLELARAAMPANLKLIEGMLLEDPQNQELLLFAAQGFYGYSYGFIEIEDKRARTTALPTLLQLRTNGTRACRTWAGSGNCSSGRPGSGNRRPLARRPYPRCSGRLHAWRNGLT